MALRDEPGSIATDEDGAALFPTQGQPVAALWRPALIRVFQFAERVSDAQATASVRARIAWQDALSLALDDPGFNLSILSEFRDRLIAGSRELHLWGGQKPMSLTSSAPLRSI